VIRYRSLWPNLARLLVLLSVAAIVPAAAPARAVDAVPAAARPPEAIAASSSWYRYQGAADSGECADANCGPAVIAMAIGYATGRTVAIKDIRAYLSGDSCRGTDYSDATVALDHWGIGYRSIYGMASLEKAVNSRDHIVLAIVNMGYISRGSDYLVPRSDPAKHYGRYHTYTSGHFVVVKGITDDGEWVVVNDPYVFDPKLGFYRNGAPKGRDRYYAYAEFAKAYRYYGSEGIEIVPE
jgi:hypothetical protein